MTIINTQIIRYITNIIHILYIIHVLDQSSTPTRVSCSQEACRDRVKGKPFITQSSLRLCILNLLLVYDICVIQVLCSLSKHSLKDTCYSEADCDLCGIYPCQYHDETQCFKLEDPHPPTTSSRGAAGEFKLRHVVDALSTPIGIALLIHLLSDTFSSL